MLTNVPLLFDESTSSQPLSMGCWQANPPSMKVTGRLVAADGALAVNARSGASEQPGVGCGGSSFKKACIGAK